MWTGKDDTMSALSGGVRECSTVVAGKLGTLSNRGKRYKSVYGRCMKDEAVVRLWQRRWVMADARDWRISREDKG